MGMLIITVIAVDKSEKMLCVNTELRTLIITRRCADSPHSVTIHGHTCDVEHPAANAFVGLSFPSDAQHHCFTLNLVHIESSDAVTISDRGQVH